MSVVSLTEPWPIQNEPLPQPRPATANRDADRVGFAGKDGPYWRLMLWGALLQAVTLGLYRFWLFTDMRRYLWSSTVIDGESLEYTGTPVELLLGFLIAIGILIPIYAVLFVASLELGIVSQLSSALGVVVFALFGKYASYRARRYRLTRTVLRGLRFHQTGSAVLYAILALLWLIANVTTLGLSYPWAAASLERYKMRHTFYGAVGGGFTGSGWCLLVRGIPIWLAVAGPVAVGLAVAGTVLDWPAIMQAMALGKAPAILGALLKTASFDLGVETAVGGLALSMVLLVFLYPAFQAIVMRWWLGGLHLGEARATSDLLIRRYYGAYLRYAAYVIGIGLTIVIMVGIMIAVAASNGTTGLTGGQSVAAVVLGIAGYAAFLLPAWACYQVVVTLRLWRAAARSVTILGLATLDDIQARDASSSAVGEGLADALLGAAAI